MNEYYSDVDFLPPVPPELILDVNTIQQGQNVGPTANMKSNFGVYEASPDIYSLFTPYLDKPSFIRWQINTSDLPIHYDWGDSTYKFIYLIQKGGENATTKFWSEKPGDPYIGGSFGQEDRELMFEISKEEYSWFRINVKKPHQVVNITSPRLALIIRSYK